MPKIYFIDVTREGVAKLIRNQTVDTTKDAEVFQNDINAVYEWSTNRKCPSTKINAQQ